MAPEATLTIGAVAEATGVSIDVLRAWEARYGFPTPSRHGGGHRRYTQADVAQVRQVQRDRDAGMSLKAAIGRARTSTDGAELSIYAGLRRRWPDQPVIELSKRTLIALSNAIEDECLARGGRPALVGSFQRERYYRQSQDRWNELARTATWSAVFADFEMTTARPRSPTEVAMPIDHPMLREWAVIWDGLDCAVCLVGIERAGHTRVHEERRFEALWSVDPEVVREATSLGLSLVRTLSDIATPELPPPSAIGPNQLLRTVTSLLARTVTYLDR